MNREKEENIFFFFLLLISLNLSTKKRNYLKYDTLDDIINIVYFRKEKMYVKIIEKNLFNFSNRWCIFYNYFMY